MSDHTLTLQDFIRLLATRVNCDEAMAADFIREFSSATTHGLVTDGFVNIDGLGSFRVVNDVDDTPTVEFAPASSLAASVNEPFSMFEPVELAESYSDEEVTPPPIPERFRNTSAPAVAGETEPDERSGAEMNTEIGECAIHEEVPPIENPAPLQPPAQPLPVMEAATEKEHPAAPPSVPEPPESPESPEPQRVTINCAPEFDAPRRDTPLPVLLEPESHVTVKRVGHTTLTLILAAAAALLAGVLIGLFLGYNFHRSISTLQHRDMPSMPETIEETETEITEELPEAPDEPEEDTIREDAEPAEQVAPTVVTDTVAPGNYLSIMAKRHYGSAKFWVYIYLENKDKIRHPDNLEDGMVLIIPPAEKYGIDPADKESLARAQREATRVANEQ